MVRLTDHPAMTIAVDLGRKATKQTNKQTKLIISLYHPYNGGEFHCTFHVIAVSCSSSSSSSSSRSSSSSSSSSSSNSSSSSSKSSSSS